MRPPVLRSRLTAAFSLIEIVLAVGIISFALVGILGLFPVALEAAAESRQETQATFIAQQVFSGLSAPAPFLPDVVGSKQGKKADLRSNQNNPPLYFGQDGEQLSGSADALYEARVEWIANQPSDGLTRVDLTVITPANLGSNASASEYPFVSLVRQPAAPAPSPAP